MDPSKKRTTVFSWKSRAILAMMQPRLQHFADLSSFESRYYATLTRPRYTLSASEDRERWKIFSHIFNLILLLIIYFEIYIIFDNKSTTRTISKRMNIYIYLHYSYYLILICLSFYQLLLTYDFFIVLLYNMII